MKPQPDEQNDFRAYATALWRWKWILLAFLRRRGEVMALAGPIIYPMIFLIIAYALSAGNAGTGFRYRTHIVVLTVAALIALRKGVVPKPVPEPEVPQPVRPVERPLAAVQ